MATGDSTAIGHDPIARTVVWGARLAWLALAVAGGAAFGTALSTHGRAVQVTGTVGLWAGWGVVALALLVPSTVALSVVRVVVPMAMVASVVAALGGDDTVERVVCVALTVLVTAMIANAEFGQLFAQGSAYGDEERFVLRPPVPYLVPVVVSWCVWCAAVFAGPLLLAARSWVLGAAITPAGAGLTWFLGRRFHRLSRRWVVLVPAGIVLHDQLVLAETSMFPKATLVHTRLALADTQAADLTGPAAGMAVEIAVADVPTVVLAPTRTAPRGTALHVRSVLVAPSRPGRLLAAVARRGFPVA